MPACPHYRKQTMARFNEIGTATIPGNGTRLRLLQRNDEFSIKIAAPRVN